MRCALCLLAVTSCVTFDGERRFVSERRLPVKCDDGAPRASLDPARDRVRFILSRRTSCDDAVEATYETPRLARLDVTPRTATSLLSAAAFAVPWQVLLSYAFPVSPTAHYEYFHPTAFSRERELGRDVGLYVLTFVPTLIVGGAVWWALGEMRLRVSSREEVVRHSQALDEPVVSGIAASPSLAPRPVDNGRLELSLDEAGRVALGNLTLDGAPVALEASDLDRLDALSDCREALAGFDATAAAQGPLEPQRYRWDRANACDAHGWELAQPVIEVLWPRFQGVDALKRDAPRRQR